MTDIANLEEKDRIATCIYDLFIGTDQRDWQKVRACFTDVVQFDMSSLAGGTAQRLTPQQITDAWDTGLRTLEHVHHQAGNLQIEVSGNSAKAFCYAIALHHRTTNSGSNVRRFVGSYDFGLRKSGEQWRIASFRFNVKFVDGNLDLEKEPE